MPENFDLDGYLKRLGVPARGPSRAALDELHEAHVRTFTFDNIDVLLEQHPGVSLDAVAGKFVGRGRGGYCFEHATALAAALEQLGYAAEMHLGRVGDPPDTGRTHAVLWIELDGRTLLADPGFGLSLLRPIPLENGAIDDYSGWSYRVRRNGRRWELQRWRDESWLLMHTHDELPVIPVDLTVGHHFTSTYPESHFRHMLMLAKHLPGRHVTVTQSTVTLRTPGTPTEHRGLRDGELAEWLGVFEVPLSADEQERLIAKVAELPTLER